MKIAYVLLISCFAVLGYVTVKKATKERKVEIIQSRDEKYK